MHDNDLIRCSSFDGTTNSSYSVTDPWEDDRLEMLLDGPERRGASIIPLGVVIAVFALFIVALAYFLARLG